MLRAQLSLRGVDQTGWLIDSAGIYANEGNPPTSKAIAAAQKFGVDISALRSRRFNNEDVERFEYILAMDLDHLDFIRATGSATASSRLALLPDPESDQRHIKVPDPYGRSKRFYARSAGLIWAGIERWLDNSLTAPAPGDG